MKSFLTALVLSVAVFGCCVLAPAQTQQGRIVGRVTDQTGAIVPKATVIIRNTETGLQRVLETNSAGEYQLPISTPASMC